jgi:hypothetical protein
MWTQQQLSESALGGHSTATGSTSPRQVQQQQQQQQQPESSLCYPCPDGGICVAGMVIPDQGYYQPHPRSAAIHLCPNIKACTRPAAAMQNLQAMQCTNRRFINPEEVTEVLPYTAMQCKAGYAGPFCLSCYRPGRFPWVAAFQRQQQLQLQRQQQQLSGYTLASDPTLLPNKWPTFPSTEAFGLSSGRCRSCPHIAVAWLGFLMARLLDIAIIALLAMLWMTLGWLYNSPAAAAALNMKEKEREERVKVSFRHALLGPKLSKALYNGQLGGVLREIAVPPIVRTFSRQLSVISLRSIRLQNSGSNEAAGSKSLDRLAATPSPGGSRQSSGAIKSLKKVSENSSSSSSDEAPVEDQVPKDEALEDPAAKDAKALPIQDSGDSGATVPLRTRRVSYQEPAAGAAAAASTSSQPHQLPFFSRSPFSGQGQQLSASFRSRSKSMKSASSASSAGSLSSLNVDEEELGSEKRRLRDFWRRRNHSSRRQRSMKRSSSAASSGSGPSFLQRSYSSGSSSAFFNMARPLSMTWSNAVNTMNAVDAATALAPGGNEDDANAGDLTCTDDSDQPDGPAVTGDDADATAPVTKSQLLQRRLKRLQQLQQQQQQRQVLLLVAVKYLASLAQVSLLVYV